MGETGDAGAEERALKQALRIQELEANVDALRSERAALIEHLRVVRAHTGLEGAAREVKSRVKGRLGALRHRGSRAPEPVPAVPLAALPATSSGAAPVWQPAVDLAGDVRPALLADPPTQLSWRLEVPPGAAVRGVAGLRPGAWDQNSGGIDLVVTATPHGAEEPATSLVLGIDPASRVADRRWVPWRLELPAGSITVSIEVRQGADASPQYAWAVIGEPELELPGLPPRAPGRAVAVPTAAGEVPRIALLLPVHNPDPGLLDRTLASVFAQTAADWELCICDDGSTDPLVRSRLAQAAADPRVRLTRHETAKGISGATNAAIALTRAPYVGTLDHDDLLAPDALERVGGALAAWPDTDLLYTDNDLLAGSRRFAASLKPGWSPDLLRAVMYTLHFSVYRREMLEELGGWRSAFDGAQDHDLVLRLMERSDRIRHLPRVLAHWRAHAGSAALGDLAKPTAYDRGREAIDEHLRRTGRAGATVERLPQAGRYRVRYPRTWPVTVRMLVEPGAPAGEVHHAAAAVLAALRADDRLVLQPAADGSEDVTAQALAGLDDPRLEPGAAATAATLLLDGSLAPVSPEAIDELVGHLEAGAAAAGGLVLDGRGLVAAGGVAFPRGLPVPLHAGADPDDAAAHPSLTVVSNRLAVAGAVAVPGVAAASADLVALSLAAAASGRVVWSPHARFAAGEHAAAWLRTTRAEQLLRLDRGACSDPFWNPLRWADSGAEVVPESVHENPLLDLPDA